MSASLTNRSAGGGTGVLNDWGMDAEYGVLRDVLIGPMEHYGWQTGNAMSRRSMRIGRRYDPDVARTQFQEMLDACRQADVTTLVLEADPACPIRSTHATRPS